MPDFRKSLHFELAELDELHFGGRIIKVGVSGTSAEQIVVGCL